MHYRFGRLAGVAVVAGLVMVSLAAQATTRYISDELSINMRGGPGTSYRITELLDAGDQVQTLSESKGWTKVRTQGGETGFVLTRFLSEQPAANTRIASFKSGNETLKKENAELKDELSEALHGSKELGQTKRKLVSENKDLEQNLQQLKETSADAIRIGKENRKFREQLMSARSDVERLRHENEALQSRRDGMKIGALIMVGGIVVGLVLPLFRRSRKKNSWDSL